ncbi:hypothetical protein GCM10008018_15020 [Paenibacillus marchantiophytorum]|uniref:HAD family hydrolase n=2 Tax=Paenibacillus marchantiophytorum TaxID=1619310 RepID=A0ABQ2BW71_9BACL|nr:hypothetical protein GCM10008018_15020 [Paenibacillus marchantiophytorum]
MGTYILFIFGVTMAIELNNGLTDTDGYKKNKKHTIEYLNKISKQQEAVYIGDEWRDIIAYERSGIHALSYGSPELLSEGPRLSRGDAE